MEILKNHFTNREELITYVRNLAPWAANGPSPIRGGHMSAHEKLSKIDPVGYCRNRNFGDGKVTKLSPYVHHGIISLNEIRNDALSKCAQPEEITKFIQELAWRDFWQRLADKNPQWIWQDIEPYKTGFMPGDYLDDLPDDISKGKTGIACIDAFIRDLLDIGYVHNHARMYLASYVIHFRRIKWQAGAKWFLEHLLDGDEASNNFSWQWVASTFSDKPYIFNLENVDKYFGDLLDTTAENNKLLNATYEELKLRLFPHMEGAND